MSSASAAAWSAASGRVRPRNRWPKPGPEFHGRPLIPRPHLSIRGSRPVDGAIKKVIVIGLDGLSPKIVSRLLAAGQLPNLARLKEQGGIRRVATTRPAQTPVAWSTFATGTNPGGHGIFDFLRRNPKTYLPDLALNRYEQKNAFLPPKAVNLRRRDAGLGAAQGRGPRRDRPALPLHVSARPDPRPDALGHGRPRPPRRAGHRHVLHHRRRGQAPRERERRPAPAGDGDGSFTDPPDRPAQPQDGRRPPRRDRRSGSIARAGGSSLRLRRHAQGAGGPPRALERLAAGQVQARAAPVGPRDGAVPPRRAASRSWRCTPRRSTSTPTRRSSRSASPSSTPASSPARSACIYTTGMVEDHAGLNNERISEDGVPRPVRDRLARARGDDAPRAGVVRRRAVLLPVRHARPRPAPVLAVPRARPPGQPRQAARSRASPRSIDDAYRRCDAVVGKALEYADDQTLVIALSDHGFNSFRRGVHLNTWLHDHGFLALKDGVRPGRGGRRPAPAGRLGPDAGLCPRAWAGST